MSDDNSKKIAPERVSFVKEAVCKTVSAVGPNGADDLDVSVLSGGITNELYRVKRKSDGSSVVVRVYGKETERLISRTAEQFFQSKFLHTFGTHENALVYEFLDGYRALEPDELPKFADGIARALAAFQIKATASILDPTAADKRVSIYAEQQLYSLNTCVEWLDVAVKACTDRPEKLAGLKDDVESKVRPACRWMHNILSKTLAAADANKDVLFVTICHNDLLSGNVMVKREATRGDDVESGRAAGVRFIDFEYARRDFALFDVADHWTEWAGYDNDFSKYPSAEAQRRFLRAYFEARGDIKPGEDNAHELISRAMVTTNFLTLASTLAWAVWAVVQEAFSCISFPYAEYHRQKFRRFEETRLEFMVPFVKNILKLDPKEFEKM